MVDETLQLVIALADVRARERGAVALARHVGVNEVRLLVPDPELSVLLPAPGFPQTATGFRALREFLARGDAKVEHGEVALGDDIVPVTAIRAHNGVVLALVGGQAPSAVVEALARVLPLLAATVAAELEAVVEKGNAMAAHDANRRAQHLASTLDTMRGDLERSLRESARLAVEAERASRAKDEFLAMLGHELRNPLAPIVTALALMKMRGDESSRAERDVIERQISHVVQLVDDLLDVSRITGGKITLRRARVRLRDVVARAAEMAMPLVEERRHRLIVDVDDEVELDGDAGRLAQIVSNLLNNAAKYTPDGGTVSIEGRREDGAVVIRVRDTGVGIGEKLLPHVFDLFTQAPQTIERGKGGLGLGLAIVKRLVELHDGTVEATSDGCSGSEFLVRLPAAEDRKASRVEPTTRAIAAPPRVLKILVVDDNADAAWLLAQLLEACGHVVELANDGPTALRILERFPADAALLDIGLPVMDGYELAKTVRATNEGMSLIAITGYGQPEDREASRLAGFDAHLVKPVDIDDILELLAVHAPAQRVRSA